MVYTVCLDLMGVVLFDPYLKAIAAGVDAPFQEIMRQRDAEAWPAFECGLIDEAEFERRFWTNPDGAPPFNREAFHAARREGYRFMDGMEALIAELRAAGLALHVASNYPVWIEELRETFALDQRFDGVWASHHLGVRKPDARFYEMLLEQVGQPAQACVFVDDRPENTAAAAALGMATHDFTSADALRAFLADHAILSPP